MRRETRANRLRIRLGCASLALAIAPGCALFSSGAPEEPMLSQAELDARIAADIDAAIARAMPEVSYESQNPAMTDPLGRTDPSIILRSVETLGGKARIKCRKVGENIFGQCVFPPPEAP